LDVADVTESTEGLRVAIRRSKTDQESAGQTIAIVRGNVACPVGALRVWLEAAGIVEGPIFRRIRGKRAVTAARLRDSAVAVAVKAGVARLGLPPDVYSGHSLRAGLVTSAARRGVDLFKLTEITRHRSLETLKGYVRDGIRTLAARSNARVAVTSATRWSLSSTSSKSLAVLRVCSSRSNASIVVLYSALLWSIGTTRSAAGTENGGNSVRSAAEAIWCKSMRRSSRANGRKSWSFTSLVWETTSPPGAGRNVIAI
jgi:hypothetical protein